MLIDLTFILTLFLTLALLQHPHICRSAFFHRSPNSPKPPELLVAQVSTGKSHITLTILITRLTVCFRLQFPFQTIFKLIYCITYRNYFLYLFRYI